jgi:hypothetical protein
MVEAGKMTLFIEEFDVGKLVAEVVGTVQPLVHRSIKKGRRSHPLSIAPLAPWMTSVGLCCGEN